MKPPPRSVAASNCSSRWIWRASRQNTARVREIFDAARRAAAARLIGLMLLPPAVDDSEAARPWFRKLRALRDTLQAEGVPASMLSELSMGMSHDYEIAVEEGATFVRVGTAIFGRRGPA
jgi:PLP dependent protein